MSIIDKLPRDCLLDLIFFLPGDEIAKLERLNKTMYRLLHITNVSIRPSSRNKRRTASFHLMNNSNASSSNASTMLLTSLTGRDLWLYICELHYSEQMKHRRKYPSVIQPQLFYMYQLKTDWYNEMHNLERMCSNLEELLESSKSVTDCCVLHPDLMDIYAKLYRMDCFYIGQNITEHFFYRAKLDLEKHYYPFLHNFDCEKGEKKRMILLVHIHESDIQEVTQLQRKQPKLQYTVPLDKLSKDSEHANFLEQKIIERKEAEARMKQTFAQMDRSNMLHYEDFNSIAPEDYTVMSAAGSKDIHQFIGYGQANTKLTVKMNRLYQCWVQRWAHVLMENPRYTNSTTTLRYDLQHVNIVPILHRFDSLNYLRMANGVLMRRAVYARYLQGLLTTNS
jgi:hypothetical protein